MDERMRTKPFFVLCMLLCVSPLWSQSTAELRGSVVDAAHRPVVSALVIINAQDASLMRASTTDDSGEFEFTALPVGTYTLQVRADSFTAYRASDIRASIGQALKLDIVLSQSGNATASSRATEASMVDISNVQLGVVMGTAEVTELPLKSRDTFELLQLQPECKAR